MSDLLGNIYLTVSIDRVKVTLDKLHKFYYVLEYKDQKYSSIENPVKTQEIQWTDLRFTFKLDENEAKDASFKFQLWGPATKLKRSDFIIAETTVNFKDFLAKHVPHFEPVEREPQYNHESVFIRKGKEHGSLLLSVEVTGWKAIDSLLKSDDKKQHELAFQNLKMMATSKKFCEIKNAYFHPNGTSVTHPKLAQYIRAETFQTINDAIKRSIKSAKRVKSPRKDTEKLIDEQPAKTEPNKPEADSARKGFLELWDMLSKIDVNMRTKLLSLGALQSIKRYIKCGDIEIQLFFMEVLKQFFTLAAHQKEVIKEGLLKKLISLVNSDELKIQTKAFEILLYFDEVHQPEMIRLGLVKKLISLLKHPNPSVQAKALELVQYFDAKHQDLLITTGALKELTDLIQLDPKDAFTQGLILKTLSVISHFDVAHQREIIEQQMVTPILELLKLDSEKIKLKTLAVVEGFDPAYEQKFIEAGLLKFINILLDDERIAVKSKAFETVTKLKHHTKEIIEVGILDRLLNLMNDSNVTLQKSSFEFIKMFPATQSQLIDAGVLKNLHLVLKSNFVQSAPIIQAALEYLLEFEPQHHKTILDNLIYNSILGIMAEKVTWTTAPFNKILALSTRVIHQYLPLYENELVKRGTFGVLLDMMKLAGRIDESIIFDIITSFKRWREHMKPHLRAFVQYVTDARDKVRKQVIDLIGKYPEAEHIDLIESGGLIDVLITSFMNGSQNQIVAQSFFALLKSLKNYQQYIFKSEAEYQKMIKIAKLHEYKRLLVLDILAALDESIKPKVLKFNLLGNLLEFAQTAPTTSKFSGAALLDLIRSFDGWKEALLDLKALKNLTNFLNNPVKDLQIKSMDLLEEFSNEHQSKMMEEGLIQALLQTIIINDEETVQNRALDYLTRISAQPKFMEVMCTVKDASLGDGFAIRMDKGTAHPSLKVDESNVSVDATINNYTAWRTCYGAEPISKGVKCWEMILEADNMNNFMVGICTRNQRNTEYIGQNVNGWGFYYSSGSTFFYHAGVSTLHKTFRLKKGDGVGIIYDADQGQLELYVNDEYVGIVFGGITGDVYPAVSLYNATDVVSFRPAPQLALKREFSGSETAAPMNPVEAEVINTWIGRPADWYIGYKASVHGWNTRTFHARCDFKGPNITIVRTASAVFGGYSSMSWASSGGYKRDNEAFLFSLKNPHNLPPSKHVLYRNQQNSIYHDTSSGPTFGGGFDMYINLSSRESSYSNLGFSYQAATTTPPGTNAAYYFTNLQSQWNIVDVEVYLQHAPKKMQRKVLLYQLVRTMELVKPTVTKKLKDMLFSIANRKAVYKKYLSSVVTKILKEPALLKPMQTHLEELKAGFGAAGIELLDYEIVSVNGEKKELNKNLAKQDATYFEAEAPFDLVLKVHPKKIKQADESNNNNNTNTAVNNNANSDNNNNTNISNNNNDTNDNTNNNNNTNTNVKPVEEEMPYLTHFIISAPVKHLSDKMSASKDILCFLSNDEPDLKELAKYNDLKFNDDSFEYKQLLNLKAEKGLELVENDSLLEIEDKDEPVKNNNLDDDKEDEELKALKKFLRDVKLGIFKPPVAEPVQTNEFGYVFVNDANERVRYKDMAMVDLTQFAQGIISYRVEYLANGNFEWLSDTTAVEDVKLVPPRPKKEEKDEAKEREEKERLEREEKEREAKEREERELKIKEAKEKAERVQKTPEEREKDRIAAILADLQRDETDTTDKMSLLSISEPNKPVAVIDLDSLAEKPLKEATLARYVTVKVLRAAKQSTLATLNHISLVGFYKSINNQPLPPPTEMPDVAKRFGFTKEGNRLCTFESSGDKNGLIYWIGTQEGKNQTWSNPAESKRVVMTTSHPMFNTWMKPELILDRGQLVNYWGSDLPLFFTLDLLNYEIYPTHFTIRHSHNQPYGYIQNFSLLGSKDANTWVELFKQAACPFDKPHDMATFTVPEGQGFFRYFRLTQQSSYKDSPNFTGGPFMFVSHFELYGTVRFFS